MGDSRLDANATKLADLFDPELIADLLDVKLTDAIKFAPLASVNYSLVGRPGSTVKLPAYTYIGEASDVPEGDDIPISKLEQDAADVEIKKVGKGVQITDEAALNGFGDAIGEAVNQLALSIADKVDNDIVAALDAQPNKFDAKSTGITADAVADALAKMGEDIDGTKVLFVSPSVYTTLRKSKDWLPASDIAADIAIKGVVGMVQGCIVAVTNRAKDNAYIVKPGAIGIFTKRETMVETDRDIINKSNVITADRHYATYVMDSNKTVTILGPVSSSVSTS